MNFFKSQDEARRNTGRLVALFAIAVISLIVMTNLLFMFVFGYFSVEHTGQISIEQLRQQFDWQVFLIIGVAVIVVITLGSLYKILALAGGGARIAEMLDAELLVYGNNDFRKQRLLNIVEEMAIASGTPVPPVYLLDEDGINAFAAGYKPGDAIIGVTRGAIEKLNREQLQGVIAHEFSHILNGDMKLNIRLIGLLHGILLIGMIGYYILRSSPHTRRSKDSGGAAILGLGLVVIGYAGTFFGNLIKAAVSRQREFLADASAVQFTRNPEGIAGALKRIGGDAAGSIIENPAGIQISHALFSQGIKTWLGSLYATHPPLERRIVRIQPSWDGKFDYATHTDAAITAETGAASQQSGAEQQPVIVAAIAAAMTSGAIVDQTAQPTPTSLAYAHQLLQELPAEFTAAVNDPFAARAVIYFMILDKHQSIRDEQLIHLKSSADTGVYEETMKLVRAGYELKEEFRLPLVDMALASLHQLSDKQYVLFKQNLNALIEIDNKISLLEWSISKIVFHHLDPVFVRRVGTIPQNLRLKQVRKACSVLLSVLIYAGKQHLISDEDAFAKAIEELKELDIRLLPKNQISLAALNQSLDRLARLKPLEKPRLLKACAIGITADQKINAKEVELYRAISAILDCPMPPLIV
ncbi:MAG: M48 family metallopeptidase [Gammaproteobacteria bacterium]|nr:M48 family metallopeptidase [Gammaproteobacteria bacterium]